MVQSRGYNAWEGAPRAAPLPGERGRDDVRDPRRAVRPPYTCGTDALQHHVWVDAGGSSSGSAPRCRRHPHGGGRGYALRDGPIDCGLYALGSWTGPRPRSRSPTTGRRSPRCTPTNHRRRHHSSSASWWNRPGGRGRLQPRTARTGPAGRRRCWSRAPPSPPDRLAVRGAGVHRGRERTGVLGRLLEHRPGPDGLLGPQYHRSYTLVGSLYGYDFDASRRPGWRACSGAPTAGGRWRSGRSSPPRARTRRAPPPGRRTAG